MLRTRQKKRFRSTSAFGIVEAITSALFVIVAVITSLDCWFMISAARVNDAACRDAARAAALASNSTNANFAANAVAQSYAVGSSSYMTSPQVTVTYNDFGVSSGSPTTPPANTAPSVTVVTTTTVKPIVPIVVLGSSLGNITFTQSYSFPIITTKSGVTAQNVASGN